MPRAERRVDWADGVAYTWYEFVEFYGEKKAAKIWEAATARDMKPKPKVKVKAQKKKTGPSKAGKLHTQLSATNELNLSYGVRPPRPPRQPKAAKEAAPAKTGPKIKLTYFAIEGAAEKVRLAFALGKVAFEDERIDRSAWEELKPKTKFGQLPIMTIGDGEPLAQSGAMLRYAGKRGGLYPTHPAAVQQIEEVIGLQEDVARAMAPGLYIGMRPQIYGYKADMPEAERKEIQARLRKTLVEGDLPRMLGYFEAMLAQNGTGWFVGKKPTIADCQVIPMLRTIRKGVQDGIPTTLFDDLPNLKKFYNAFHELPQIKAYYKGASAP